MELDILQRNSHTTTLCKVLFLLKTLFFAQNNIGKIKEVLVLKAIISETSKKILA